jgi:hypothetical protein
MMSCFGSTECDPGISRGCGAVGVDEAIESVGARVLLAPQLGGPRLWTGPDASIPSE